MLDCFCNLHKKWLTQNTSIQRDNFQSAFVATSWGHWDYMLLDKENRINI